jgi:tetratricopeptide (TPR) repeat protein
MLNERRQFMTLAISSAILAFSLCACVLPVLAQADEACREFGETPTREIGRQSRLASYVYGRVVLKGLNVGEKPPKVIVIYTDNAQPPSRQPVGRSGNFCFKRVGTSGMLIIEVDGVESVRRAVSDLGAPQLREDFEVFPDQVSRTAPPAVISTRFSRPPNEKTSDLYKKAAGAEGDSDPKKAIEYVKNIVAIDAGDFIAWAKLGSLYLQTNSTSEAEQAFRKALELQSDYTPALLNLGIIHGIQSQFPAAIELFQKAIASEPNNARGYRLLGEAYLQNREGSLGLTALDKALELDPIGMAECHLLKARLYDLVGAKNLASNEYRQFLAKVPKYPDRKSLDKYIRDNPDK